MHTTIQAINVTLQLCERLSDKPPFEYVIPSKHASIMQVVFQLIKSNWQLIEITFLVSVD